MAEKTHRNSLKPGYTIGSYEITGILGQGGFGITYLAKDTSLGRMVAIKEYLPIELAIRETDASISPVSGEHSDQFNWGLERFISEARTLARFKHPNIVRILTVFQENNTAYIVMEYEQGRPFHELIKGKKTLEEKQLKKLLYPLMDGLEAVHKADFIHRDIKPANIYIREDDSPVLIDFGSARQSLFEYTRTLTTMVSPGYAPFEQYVGKSDNQGPWTDIYALGATLYRAVTGITPSDSMARSEAILHTGRDTYVTATEISGGKYSPTFLAAIDWAMAFKTEERPQSIAQWRSSFEDEYLHGPTLPLDSQASTIDAAIPSKVTPAEKPNGITRNFARRGLFLLIILAAIGLLSQIKQKNSVQNEPEPAIVTDKRVQPADNESRDDMASSGSESSLDETRSISSIPFEEKQKFQSIQKRLQANPDDQQARRQLKQLADTFERNIKRAVNRGEYDLAREYIYEIQKNADITTAAYKKLDELLKRVNEIEKQANN